MPDEITLGPHLLKRQVRHDPRSREYPARVVPVQKVSWTVHGPALNQGQLGSCTSNALSGWRNAAPEHVAGARLANEANAKSLYHEETVLQGGPEYPPDDPGGSGIGVCKAAVEMGLITSYTHGFGLEHAQGAIGVSPFIIGINWYKGMYTPDHHGVVAISGPLEGGHEVLVYGYDPGAGMWSLRNSWGSAWGVNGSFHMTDATLDTLLKEQGDITVPVSR